MTSNLYNNVWFKYVSLLMMAISTFLQPISMVSASGYTSNTDTLDNTDELVRTSNSSNTCDTIEYAFTNDYIQNGKDVEFNLRTIEENIPRLKDNESVRYADGKFSGYVLTVDTPKGIKLNGAKSVEGDKYTRHTVLLNESDDMRTTLRFDITNLEQYKKSIEELKLNIDLYDLHFEVRHTNKNSIAHKFKKKFIPMVNRNTPIEYKIFAENGTELKNNSSYDVTNERIRVVYTLDNISSEIFNVPTTLKLNILKGMEIQFINNKTDKIDFQIDDNYIKENGNFSMNLNTLYKELSPNNTYKIIITQTFESVDNSKSLLKLNIGSPILSFPNSSPYDLSYLPIYLNLGKLHLTNSKYVPNVDFDGILTEPTNPNWKVSTKNSGTAQIKFNENILKEISIGQLETVFKVPLAHKEHIKFNSVVTKEDGKYIYHKYRENNLLSSPNPVGITFSDDVYRNFDLLKDIVETKDGKQVIKLQYKHIFTPKNTENSTFESEYKDIYVELTDKIFKSTKVGMYENIGGSANIVNTSTSNLNAIFYQQLNLNRNSNPVILSEIDFNTVKLDDEDIIRFSVGKPSNLKFKSITESNTHKNSIVFDEKSNIAEITVGELKKMGFFTGNTLKFRSYYELDKTSSEPLSNLQLKLYYKEKNSKSFSNFYNVNSYFSTDKTIKIEDIVSEIQIIVPYNKFNKEDFKDLKLHIFNSVYEVTDFTYSDSYMLKIKFKDLKTRIPGESVEYGKHYYKMQVEFMLQGKKYTKDFTDSLNSLYYVEITKMIEPNIYADKLEFNFTKELKDNTASSTLKWNKVTTCDNEGICKNLDKEFIDSLGKTTLFKVDKSKLKLDNYGNLIEGSLTSNDILEVSKEEMNTITRKDLLTYTYLTQNKVFVKGSHLNYSKNDLDVYDFSKLFKIKSIEVQNRYIHYQTIPEEYFFECGDFPIKSSSNYCDNNSITIINKEEEPYNYTYIEGYNNGIREQFKEENIAEKKKELNVNTVTYGNKTIDINYKGNTQKLTGLKCNEVITICEEKTIQTELSDVKIELFNVHGEVIKQDTIKNGEYKFNVFDEDLKGLNKVKLSKPNYKTIEIQIKSFLNNCEIDGNLVPETCKDFTITSNVNEAKVLVENTKTTEKYEGTIKDGKFVVNKNLSKVDTFKITVSKEGYVTKTIETTIEDCIVDLQLTKNICDTFTVNTNVKDGFVELEHKTTKEVIEGKIVDNKFVTDTPLKKGDTYKLSVSSYGYKDITKEIVIDDCEIELTLEKDVCEAFTVNVGKDDVKVTIKLGSKVVSEGLTKDGKYVATEPLDKVELYTITLENDGYHTKTETTTLSECEIKLDIVEKPIVKPQICENLVINVGVDGATVKVEDYKNDVVFEGISVNGKVQLDEALPKNIPFKVTVTKGTSSTVVFETIGTDDDCELTIDFKYIEYCTEFTLTTNVDNTTVKIVDSNNKTVFDSVVNGKSIKLNNQLEQGKKYKVTVTKEGFKTFTKEITVDNLCAFNVTLEKEEPIKNVCTEFTVKSNVDGAKVTITDTDKNSEFKVTGTITKGEFISTKPLEEGKEYEVLIEKEGYESIDTVFTVTKECEITLEMTKIVPKVCDNFTVNVNIDGAKVVVKDNEGKVIEEGNTKDKKHIITKPLTKGETYTIEVTKEGYKKAVKVVTIEDCIETITLEKEEPVINYCETFKVTTNVDGATITISELNGNEVVTGKSTNKEFISSKPLEQGKEYLIKVEKDGYETTEKVVKVSDCEIEINLIKSSPIEPTVCDTFTVKVNQDGATVVIKDSKGNEVSKGISKDGKFISTKPLDLKKEYSFEVTKEGYETVSFKKVITDCEETINLVKVEPKVCDNYLIKLNVDGADVVIKDSKGNEVSKGISKDGKYNVSKPLEIGKTYTIKVTKDGYKEVSYDKIIAECEETINLVKDEPKLEICESFTVNVNVDGATVVIKNALDEELVKGTSKDGKFTTNYALEKGNGYIIEVTKKGYKSVKYNFNIYDCEETVTLEKEEPKLEVCENFTVNVNVDGAKVVIKNALDEEIVKGTSKDGKFVTNYPLEIGNGYIVEVTKEGYKAVKYNFNIYECSETITLEKEDTPIQNVCNLFEVKVNVDGATVIITDSKGNVVDKGISKDNKFISNKPINKDEVYTVKLSKDGYYEKTVTTTKDSCELEVVMDTVKPNVCTNTVITVTKTNDQPLTNVSIEVREINGDSVTKGKVDKNGEFLVDKSLDFGKDYEFIIKKSGYKTQRITRTLDECLSLDIVLKRVSSGGGGGSYEPEEKPTLPEEKPTEPEEKPAEPEEKPTLPEEKPTEPEEKPIEPEEKPIVPEEKPVKPIEPIKPIIPTQPIKPLEPIRPTVPTENNLNSNVVPNYVAPKLPTQQTNSEQVNTNNSLNNKPLPQTNTENTSMLFITYGLLLLAIGTVIRRKEQEEK